MATQYIKYTKKCKKNFFQNFRGGGGHGSFWPGGGYAHACSNSTSNGMSTSERDMVSILPKSSTMYSSSIEPSESLLRKSYGNRTIY